MAAAVAVTMSPAALLPYVLFSPRPRSLSCNPSPNPRKKPYRNPSLVSASSSSSSSFRNGNTPDTECPVPLDQQPMNEYQVLSTSLPFSWASADLQHYCSRLAFVGATFALFVGLPVSTFGRGAIFDSQTDGLLCALGSVSTGLLAVTLAVLRMYLGWAYVGNRLFSATVEYEETGWYDGQIWVKTPEVLARDRLLGSFSVKPVLSRVKLTLVGLAVSLVTCVVLFAYIESPRNFSLEDNAGGKAVTGVYNDDSARSFEPDAFCGETDLS